MKLNKNYDELTATMEFGEAGSIEVSLGDLNEEIVKKLALYGLGVKCQRATAGIGKDDAKSYEAVSKLVNNLKEGKWSSPVERTSKKEIQRQFIISQLRAAGSKTRDALIKSLEATGVLKKLDIKPEDYQ